MHECNGLDLCNGSRSWGQLGVPVLVYGQRALVVVFHGAMDAEKGIMGIVFKVGLEYP